MLYEFVQKLDFPLLFPVAWCAGPLCFLMLYRARRARKTVPTVVWCAAAWTVETLDLLVYQFYSVSAVCAATASAMFVAFVVCETRPEAPPKEISDDSAQSPIS
ncbi:MAG: hypothetical protein ACI4QC_03830 [Thermoguttaceae bacterium]